MNKLIGKVAVITGSSRGIGRAIAIEFAKEGASIVINYSKDEKGAEKTLEMVKQIGVSAIIVKSDISSYQEGKELIDKTVFHFGKLDILVNNAAVSTVGIFLDSNKESIDAMINTNLTGQIYLTKHALKYLLESKGKVINISSMWGEVGASCEVLYSASKGGINLFTKALAKEVAPSGIRVNAIAPGVIDTTMNSFLSENERIELEEEIPLGRFGRAEEVAKTAVFLAGDDSSYITGQVIRVDGSIL